jgi:agmatine/peptidylarginine deiminase
MAKTSIAALKGRIKFLETIITKTKSCLSKARFHEEADDHEKQLARFISLKEAIKILQQDQEPHENIYSEVYKVLEHMKQAPEDPQRYPSFLEKHLFMIKETQDKLANIIN